MSQNLVLYTDSAWISPYVFTCFVALHEKLLLREELAGVGVQHRDGAGVERSIDGEDQHRGEPSIVPQAFGNSGIAVGAPAGGTGGRERCKLLKLRAIAIKIRNLGDSWFAYNCCCSLRDPGFDAGASPRDDGHATVSSLKLLAKREHHHIGRTSTTSGTKWRSRFWMPCCKVAVDDGQPEQAPFMLR